MIIVNSENAEYIKNVVPHGKDMLKKFQNFFLILIFLKILP